VNRKRDHYNFIKMRVDFAYWYMTIRLDTFDRNVFTITGEEYFDFKKELGEIPPKTEKNQNNIQMLGPELVQWVLKFMDTQNIHVVHLEVDGFTNIRAKCLQLIFKEMSVVSFTDATRLMFGKGNRRRRRPRLKAKGKSVTLKPRGAANIRIPKFLVPPSLSGVGQVSHIMTPQEIREWRVRQGWDRRDTVIEKKLEREK